MRHRCPSRLKPARHVILATQSRPGQVPLPIGVRPPPVTLNDGTLSRHLMCHNKIFTTTNVSHQPDSHRPPFHPPSSSLFPSYTIWWEPDPTEQRINLNEGFLRDNSRSDFYPRVHSIYRYKRSQTVSNSNSSPWKISPRAEIFGQLNQQKINSCCQNTKPYLSVIMPLGF